jgi:hypothetical protein
MITIGRAVRANEDHIEESPGPDLFADTWVATDGAGRSLLIFDSETMPDWFGMPNDKELPSTFTIDYVRAWKRRQSQ